MLLSAQLYVTPGWVNNVGGGQYVSHTGHIKISLWYQMVWQNQNLFILCWSFASAIAEKLQREISFWLTILLQGFLTPHKESISSSVVCGRNSGQKKISGGPGHHFISWWDYSQRITMGMKRADFKSWSTLPWPENVQPDNFFNNFHVLTSRSGYFKIQPAAP